MSNVDTPTINSNIYHERQIRELCALHTLNNLFQGKTLHGFFAPKNTFSWVFDFNIFNLFNYRARILYEITIGRNMQTAIAERMDKSTSINARIRKLRHQCYYDRFGKPRFRSYLV